ncbi:MAG: Polyphosphate kinase 2 [uncultured Nocardioidaceae bacterium]|uniref:Polyphosphate kinase 2 n=1 Tax=uncultured Nocardioidaceae bacterium TaxID=253824 RepID=A0A6J4LQK0_9ACTN|nr:MAG: Polyphosphate kinase 2 [uncultured Nocardioidaceae bacterium]
MAKTKKKQPSVLQTLTLPRRSVRLADHDSRATPGFSGDKAEGKASLDELGGELADLQERLYAQGRSGGKRSVLLVLQGMDTSGKGGVMRHVGGLFDPQGVHLKAFGPPSAEERRKGFLWRIRQQLPEPGRIGVFDRSHYEDVLVARVRGLSSAATIEKRYDAINTFEERLVGSGTIVVKAMLHISPDEQKERLLARLDDPTKYWKYNPGDLQERALWPEYQKAYEIALQRCNTKAAPWLVVPADRKWYRNWAIASILLETLRGMDLQWPPGDFDVDEQRRLLTESP